MGQKKILNIPDLGGADQVTVIEILMHVGDQVAIDDPVILLEGDKATMEIPSPVVGQIVSFEVKVGSRVAHGDPMMCVMVDQNLESGETPTETACEARQSSKPSAQEASDVVQTRKSNLAASERSAPPTSTSEVYTGPAGRCLARELGVDLADIKGTGHKGRVTLADIKSYVKMRLQQGSGSSVASPATFSIDFSKFGEISFQPLSKIKQATAQVMHRSWVTLPHVTQFDHIDITELETFRREQKALLAKEQIKLTLLPFVVKALIKCLKYFPYFNASLDVTGTQLVLKHYYHVGVAVDTSEGLVVPVLRDVDQKPIPELARELAIISEKARQQQLSFKDMQGGSMTVSSLGGIGGGPFTPIINAPEVAILGVSRATVQPVYQQEDEEQTWVPRLLLPVSLSYDHRVIDGANGARFLMYFKSCLTDIRTLLL